MLQLVRNQLAAATKPDEPDQPVPEPTAEPTPPATPPLAAPAPATPVPVAQTPAPTIPSPALAPPAMESTAVSTPPPPPAAEWPNAATPPGQPATVMAANTIVLQQPVIIQQTQDFYTPLNAYGDWITIPNYGRVWQPAVTMVNAEWRPYCNGGRWVFSDCGWYWQSDYSWGWAVFHYGRWCYVDRHRWVWLPDTVWAPAWVSWRRSETHCGWAPLPPGTTFRVGVGFTVGHGAQFDLQFGLSSRHYTFVANNRLGEQNLNSVMVRKEEVETIYQRSSHVEKSYDWNEKQRRVHNKGPDRDEDARARQPSARTIHLVNTSAAPVRKPAAPHAPVFAPPASIAPAAPAMPVVTPAAPVMPVVTPATPVTPAIPSTPPNAMPGRHTPKPTPAPAAPVKWHTPETPKNETPSAPAVDREPAADATPATRPPIHRRDPPAVAQPREIPAPSIPVAEPIIKPSKPITTQPTRRDTLPSESQHAGKNSKTDHAATPETRAAPVSAPEPKTEPVTLPESRATPVKTREPRVESVAVRTSRGESNMVKEIPADKSSGRGSTDKSRTDKSRTDEDDDTTTSHRRGGFQSSRP